MHTRGFETGRVERWERSAGQFWFILWMKFYLNVGAARICKTENEIKIEQTKRNSKQKNNIGPPANEKINRWYGVSINKFICLGYLYCIS